MHTIFKKSPLKETLFQLKFPTMLLIDSEKPVTFQKKVYSLFPYYEENNSNIKELIIGPQLGEPQINDSSVLVTLEDKPYANMTIPGKVQSYIASGKPIIGAINGSGANFIVNNRIGYVCKSGDSETLAKLIKGLDLNILKEIGKHSKEVYFKKYSKNIFIDRLLLTLEKHKS